MTLILASASASRRAMLEAAGVAFTACPAAIDERTVEAGLADHPAADVARALAEAKALAIEGGDALVLGSDSLVMVDGQRFDKPASREDAVRHLRSFSGRVMELHSAAALARAGEVVWSHAALARLQVRTLSDAFIGHYLDEEWPAIGYCVGCFRIEGPGVQLFDSIDGDHFTVLGMPLLAVLGALRELGELES